MSRRLTLPLKKKWFDMIKSGEKNEEMAEDICGRLCESRDSKEYNAMYLACMEAMEWKDAQAVQDRGVIRKHWQRWEEEREEEMKNNIEKRRKQWRNKKRRYIWK